MNVFLFYVVVVVWVVDWVVCLGDVYFVGGVGLSVMWWLGIIWSGRYYVDNIIGIVS